MKTILCALVIIAPISGAYAQRVNDYDQHGVYQGHSERTDNKVTYYNKEGQITGFAKQDGNRVDYYNQSGVKQGSSRIQR